jgi:hypothetical protein
MRIKLVFCDKKVQSVEVHLYNLEHKYHLLFACMSIQASQFQTCAVEVICEYGSLKLEHLNGVTIKPALGL